MFSLLNEISSTTIMWIILAIIIAIITIITVINCYFKPKTVITNSIAVGLALILAIFLANPVLALFDKLFNFSLIFFNAFMLSYAQVDILNTRVTAMNYDSVVTDFRNVEVGISPTYKNFLVNIFENTNPPNSNPTTISAIAASSMSYMVALFIVAFILFIVGFVIFKLLINLLSKKVKIKKQINYRPLCVVLGVIKGVIAALVFIITLSTLPIINVTNDYIANGFQTTRILSPIYNGIVSTEQSIYKNTINYVKINNRIYQSKENITYGVYQNDTSGCEHRVNVNIQSNTITINVLNLSTSEYVEITGDYIYANNFVYAFKDNKLEFNFQYSEKDKCFKYKTVSYDKNETYVLNLI